MNRRHVLLAAVLAVLPPPAHALVPVVDAAAIENLITTIGWLKQQYQELQADVKAVTNSLDVAGLNPSLLLPGQQNPLGGIMPQMNAIVGGQGLLSGAQQVLQQDRIYQPAGTDLGAVSMNQSSASLANLKALALQLMNTNSSRITQLTGFLGQLTGAADISQVSRIQGRLAVEQQTLDSQRAQIAQLQQLAMVQKQVQEQRALQRMRQDDDDAIAASSSNGANGSLPLSPPSSPTFIAGGG